MIQSNQGFSSMVLRLQTGVNDAGAPLYKDKSYPRVLPTVTADDIYTVGGALAGLSNWTLHHIQRLPESGERLTRYVHHIARFAAAVQQPELLAFARKDRAEDMRHQAALLVFAIYNVESVEQ